MDIEVIECPGCFAFYPIGDYWNDHPNKMCTHCFGSIHYCHGQYVLGRAGSFYCASCHRRKILLLTPKAFSRGDVPSRFNIINSLDASISPRDSSGSSRNSSASPRDSSISPREVINLLIDVKPVET